MNRPPPDPASSAARAAIRAAWLAGIAGALFAASAVAQAPMVILEEVLESSTELSSLPAQAGGTLTARECRDCGSLRLKFDERTRFYIGREQVSWAQFRKAGAAGDVRLYVHYAPGTQAITRLRLTPVTANK